MNGNCHFLFGTACVSMIALNANADAATTTLLITGGLIGSIFPDIDNPKSHMGKLAAPLSTLIGSFSALFGKSREHHRGIFHDFGIYLIGLAVCYFYFSPLIGFFIGCLSHLILDMFNPSGVPFLFGVRHIHLGRIASGSKASVLFTWICVVIVLAAGIMGHVFYPEGFAFLNIVNGYSQENTISIQNIL